MMTAEQWNRNAIRVQAERAMKAEQERDALIAVIVSLEAQLRAKDREIEALKGYVDKGVVAHAKGRRRPVAAKS